MILPVSDRQDASVLRRSLESSSTHGALVERYSLGYILISSTCSASYFEQPRPVYIGIAGRLISSRPGMKLLALLRRASGPPRRAPLDGSGGIG